MSRLKHLLFLHHLLFSPHVSIPYSCHVPDFQHLNFPKFTAVMTAIVRPKSDELDIKRLIIHLKSDFKFRLSNLDHMAMKL